MKSRQQSGLPRSDGDDHPIAWFSALLRGVDRNDKALVEEAERRLEGLGYIVVPTLPTPLNPKGVE